MRLAFGDLGKIGIHLPLGIYPLLQQMPKAGLWPPCELNISCTSTSAESRAKICTSKMHLSPPVA